MVGKEIITDISKRTLGRESARIEPITAININRSVEMKRPKRYFTSHATLGIVIILGLAILAGCTSQASIAGNQNPDYFIVDNFVGKACDDIADNAHEQFTVNQINVFSSKQESGVIVNQYPYAGKEVEKGSELTLYVSCGASPDGLKLDGLQSTHAEGILKQAGISYTIENQYDLNTEKGYVFGTAKNGEEAILYVSLGELELNVSGIPGYVTESKGYIFYTDDTHIYRMNADGTTKRTLVDARSLREIIPYDDWIVYKDIENDILHIVNWEDGKRSVEISNVINVFKVIDDMLFFEDKDGFKKYSLLSGNTYYIEQRNDKFGISDVIYKNNSMYYIHSYNTKDNQSLFQLKRLNCFTGEKLTLDDTNEIYDLYLFGNSIYYTNKLGLYLLDEAKMQGKLIASLDYKDIYAIAGDIVIMDNFDDEMIYSYNMVTGQNTELCDYYDLLWIDRKNDWVYFIKDNMTYRKKSSGQEEEFFREAIIHSGYYSMSSHDSIPSIDGWLYFFGSDEFLSRINIDTKEIEHVAGKPTEMPWWAKI